MVHPEVKYIIVIIIFKVVILKRRHNNKLFKLVKLFVYIKTSIPPNTINIKAWIPSECVLLKEV